MEEVVLLGRRGPAQAAFTNPEVRELGELARADVLCDPAQVEAATEAATPTAKRNVELFRDYAQREPSGRSHRIELRFLRSPVEIPEVVLYTQSRERIIASEYLGKLLLMRDALWAGRTDGAIVRVIVPDRPGAVREGVAFVSELIPEVERCFGR